MYHIGFLSKLQLLMMEPSRKRSRTAICHCPVCIGSERDYRTVHRHMEAVYDITVANAVEDAITDQLDSSNDYNGSDLGESTSQCGDEFDDVGQSDTRSRSDVTLPKVHVPKQEIHEFVIKEVKTKLDHGNSISLAEEHLQNVASLLGGTQVPTKWNEVLQLISSLGYEKPRHYKVCCSRDHFFY